MPARSDVLQPVLATHPADAVTTAIVLVVALTALVLTLMTLRAYRSSGNRKLLYVLWAFALFVVKGAFLVVGLLLEWNDSLLFIAPAAVDLAIVILLMTPFFR